MPEQLRITLNEEVRADTDLFLKETQQEIGQEKKEIDEYYNKILNELDRMQLIDLIDKLYANKDTKAIQQHPSHDLLAQLCLHHLGFDLEINSDEGQEPTTHAVKIFKQEYNKLYPHAPEKQFKILNSWMIGQQFFSAVKDCFEKRYFLDNTFPTLQEIAELSIWEQIIEKAQTKIGKGYERGGRWPYWFDCSWLVKYVYRQFGKELPNSAKEMYKDKAVKKIKISDLQPWDLFFSTRGPWEKSEDKIRHVGIVTKVLPDNSFVAIDSVAPKRDKQYWGWVQEREYTDVNSWKFRFWRVA